MPSLKAVERKIAAIPAYRLAFERAFRGPQSVTINNIVQAIGAYERTLITPDTAYDRFVHGDDKAMTQQQLRGMALFEAIGCRCCHRDPTFSSAGLIKPLGAYRMFPIHPDNVFIKKYDLMDGGMPRAYRVPSLRNVALTAPYFHNGSVDTLEEAVRIMAVAQLGKVLSNDPADDTAVVVAKGSGRQVKLIRDRALSDAEIADIAAFLHSLGNAATPEDRLRERKFQ